MPTFPAQPDSTRSPSATAEAAPDADSATESVPAPTSVPQAKSPMVFVGGIVFEAELAITPQHRAKGLSDRDTLPSMTGMLFVFETVTTPVFWMKGMRFPLDFIWISEDCTVAEITRDVAVPDADEQDFPRYGPSAPVAYNFEINAGEAEKHGIRARDRVRFLNVLDEAGAACEWSRQP